MDIVALPPHQIHDEVFRFRRGGAEDAGSLAQAHAEHDLVPGVLQIVPGGQLVAPSPVKLRPSEALRLRRRNPLDQAPVDQLELVVGLVVVLNQGLGDDVDQPRVTLKAGGPNVSRGRGSNKPAGPWLLPSPPAYLLGSGSGLTGAAASKKQPDRPPVAGGQDLVVVGCGKPLGAPLEGGTLLSRKQGVLAAGLFIAQQLEQRVAHSLA